MGGRGEQDHQLHQTRPRRMYYCLEMLTKDRNPHCSDLLIWNDNELLFALSSSLFACLLLFICLFVVVYWVFCFFFVVYLFVCCLKSRSRIFHLYG